jgi:hypothetical protein
MKIISCIIFLQNNHILCNLNPEINIRVQSTFKRWVIARVHIIIYFNPYHKKHSLTKLLDIFSKFQIDHYVCLHVATGDVLNLEI